MPCAQAVLSFRDDLNKVDRQRGLRKVADKFREPPGERVMLRNYDIAAQALEQVHHLPLRCAHLSGIRVLAVGAGAGQDSGGGGGGVKARHLRLVRGIFHDADAHDALGFGYLHHRLTDLGWETERRGAVQRQSSSITQICALAGSLYRCVRSGLDNYVTRLQVLQELEGCVPRQRGGRGWLAFGPEWIQGWQPTGARGV